MAPGVPFRFEINAWGGVALTRVPTEYREGLIPAHLVPPRPTHARALSPALRRLAACLTACAAPDAAPPRGGRCVPASVPFMPWRRALIPNAS